MAKSFTGFTLGLLTVVLIAGCSQNDAQGNNALDTVSTDTLTIVQEDPCTLVLIPSTSTDDYSIQDVDRAIARYQKALSGTARPLPHLERLGWAFVQKARETRDAGYYKLAEQTAGCIENQAPNSAEALLLKGHVLHNLHRFKDAEELARRLIKRRGLWFDYALLGDVLLERGALDEAVAAYQAVLDQRPGPQAYLRVAQIRRLKGDLDGALEMITQAVRTTSPRSVEAAAWARVGMAWLLMQTEDFPAAEAALAGALSLKPDYPPALHARGRLLMAQGNLEEALPLLQRVVQADPLPEFRWTLYEALRVSGLQQAAAEQQTALRQYGENEDRRTLALFLATTGLDPEMALRLARQELQQREDIYTLDAVAWALSGAGQNDSAQDYSRRALAAGSKDARLYLHAGVIAARAGDTDDAIELLNKAKQFRHMLLPSERQQLAEQSAQLYTQIPIPVPGEPVYRTNLYL